MAGIVDCEGGLDMGLPHLCTLALLHRAFIVCAGTVGCCHLMCVLKYLVGLAPQQEQTQTMPVTMPSATLQSTRGFARFPTDHPAIRPFIRWLKSLDGRAKKDSEAVAIATDISKMLMFIHPTSPRWDVLLEAKLLKAYLDHLSTMRACGMEGQLTKIQRLQLE